MGLDPSTTLRNINSDARPMDAYSPFWSVSTERDQNIQILNSYNNSLPSHIPDTSQFLEKQAPQMRLTSDADISTGPQPMQLLASNTLNVSFWASKYTIRYRYVIDNESLGATSSGPHTNGVNTNAAVHPSWALPSRQPVSRMSTLSSATAPSSSSMQDMPLFEETAGVSTPHTSVGIGARDSGRGGTDQVGLLAIRNGGAKQQLKRARQNREAQRSFRLRHKAYVKGLEDRVAELKAQLCFQNDTSYALMQLSPSESPWW
ncbi:hypothetical protein BSLG_010418 [Batrachochytrium salamandrivorans]|nr:hypothetical protein BSLG_010418 [Batrachochytrium salamandrivorans]